MQPLIHLQDLLRYITGGKVPLGRYPFFKKIGDRPLIFVHIPKTAGSSIARALNLSAPSPAFGIEKHYPAKEICRICGHDIWNEAFRFTCVRNPWARLFSHYNYRTNRGVTSQKGRNWDFNAWGKAVLGQRKLRNFRPQVEWIDVEPGYEEIDRIIRFENLEEEMKAIGNLLGQRIELPHLLKSGSVSNYTEIYDGELRDMVSHIFAGDIERFGYKFGE